MSNENASNPVADYLTQAAAAAWDIRGLADGTTTRDIKKVGIIGAGTMGGGISMNFASIGLPVTIVELSRRLSKEDSLGSGGTTSEVPIVGDFSLRG